jgi:hypothetical protein
VSRGSSSTALEPYDWRERGLLAMQWERESLAGMQCWHRAPKVESGIVSCLSVAKLVLRGRATTANPSPGPSIREQLPRESNWDGEGSPGYSDAVVERAARLVSDLAVAGRRVGVMFQMPDFGPGPGGQVDIHWDTPVFELLISVPDDLGVLPAFYGDNRGASAIKGRVESVERLVAMVASIQD